MEALDSNLKDNSYTTRIAVNLNTFDKYMPGSQLFFIPACTPTKTKSKEFSQVTNDMGNILNKNKGALGAVHPMVGSCIELEVPKDVTRWFEIKFIPEGTRFLVSFDGGNITRPRIIGRDYNAEQGGYNETEE